jgi:hypothetical protein
MPSRIEMINEGRKKRFLKHKKIEKHPISMSYAITVDSGQDSNSQTPIGTMSAARRLKA